MRVVNVGVSEEIAPNRAWRPVVEIDEPGLPKRYYYGSACDSEAEAEQATAYILLRIESLLIGFARTEEA